MANQLETYRAYVQQVLKDYASLGSPDDEVETQLIFVILNAIITS